MFFLKRENGCRNIFMTKSPRKKMPAVWSISGPTAQEIVYELATDRANVPFFFFVACVRDLYVYRIGTNSSHQRKLRT